MRIASVSCLFLLWAANLPGSPDAQWCWTEGGRRLEIESSGTIQFTDDDRDVKSLSPGGYFRVEENYLLLFAGRRYEVTADSSGRLSRRYFDHGHLAALDSQGQAWLMGVMPEVIRNSGLGAEPRLERILKQGGPAAALSEISRIRYDDPKRLYLEALITKGNLDPDQLSSAMLQARKIGSDEDKAELLITVTPYYLKDKLREAIFEVAGTIGSDEEHRRVLCEFVKRDPAGRETLRLAAKSAGRIGSDEEKTAVLVAIAGQYKGDHEIGRALLSSARSIGSDEERHHALSAVLAASGTDREIYLQALLAAAAIGSDEEKAALLIEAAARYEDGQAIRRAFFAATGNIGSDEQRRQVLSALLARPGLTAATLAEIAVSAKAIGSDEEKAKILAEMVSVNPQSPVVRAAFFEALNSIGSDDERKQVLLLIAHHRPTPVETQIEVARSAKKIGSDDDKAAVLAEISASNLQDPKLCDAFLTAVDSVGSEDDRGGILSALLARRGLPKEAVIRVIESSGKISSDEVKAHILTQAVETGYAADPLIRAAIGKVLDSMQSDNEYRRLTSALLKSGTER